MDLSKHVVTLPILDYKEMQTNATNAEETAGAIKVNLLSPQNLPIVEAIRHVLSNSNNTPHRYYSTEELDKIFKIYYKI